MKNNIFTAIWRRSRKGDEMRWCKTSNMKYTNPLKHKLAIRFNGTLEEFDEINERLGIPEVDEVITLF